MSENEGSKEVAKGTEGTEGTAGTDGAAPEAPTKEKEKASRTKSVFMLSFEHSETYLPEGGGPVEEMMVYTVPAQPKMHATKDVLKFAGDLIEEGKYIELFNERTVVVLQDRKRMNVTIEIPEPKPQVTFKDA